MFPNLRADTKRHLGETHGIEKLKILFYLCTTQEFYAIVIFRYGKYVQKVRIPIVGLILRIIYFILNKLIAEICAGVLIDLGSEIGKGFQLGHFGGIYIKAKIGENCTVAQQVVIGYKGGFSGGEVPTLGNNVFVGSGAKIIGGVKIGNNVKIGANAVVLTDIPDNCTAVGIPAKIIKK
jgi:serine O-acetyltransferase